MNYKFILLALFAAGIVGFAAFKQPVKKQFAAEKIEITGDFEPVAVLELFTSQGCSSCPSADRLLGKTLMKANGKKIFALSYHVDYWNRLGWADPFSSAAFTQRQAAYVSAMNLNGSYTPQLVVNGKEEFVGSDQSSLTRSLSKALATKSEAQFTELKLVRDADGVYSAEYQLAGNFSGKIIRAALVSNSETTAIKRGENSGLTLTNDNVVRQIAASKAEEKGTIKFAASPMPAAGNISLIAFVQEGTAGKILGAAATK